MGGYVQIMPHTTGPMHLHRRNRQRLNLTIKWLRDGKRSNSHGMNTL